jgi:hypothetical protein
MFNPEAEHNNYFEIFRAVAEGVYDEGDFGGIDAQRLAKLRTVAGEIAQSILRTEANILGKKHLKPTALYRIDIGVILNAVTPKIYEYHVAQHEVPAFALFILKEMETGYPSAIN